MFLIKDFGQDLFNPPNIAGWPTGKQWLSGQFLEKRMLKLKTHFSLSNLLNPNKSENLLKQNSNSKLKIQSAKTRSSYSKKSLTVFLDFTIFSQDTKTNKSYKIGLDANLQKARFHSIRLDGESFNIPFKFKSGGETKDFLVNNS